MLCFYARRGCGEIFASRFLHSVVQRHQSLVCNENIICFTQPDDVLIAHAMDETLVSVSQYWARVKSCDGSKWLRFGGPDEVLSDHIFF